MKKIVVLLLTFALLAAMTVQTFAMTIYVKIDAKTTITLDVNPTTTFAEIKEKIQEQQGIPVDNQLLFRHAVELRDDLTLEGWGITEGETLELSFLATAGPLNGKGEGTYYFDIVGAYDPDSTAAVISVDITWEAMSFTFTGGAGSYDTNDHLTTTEPGSWSTNTAQITVTNHSNSAIFADFGFTAAANGVKGVLTESSVFIDSAAQEKYQTNTGTAAAPVYDAPAASTSFGIDPTSPAISADASLGTVTVTLTKYDGFVYDATGVDNYDTFRDALSAACQSGYTQLAITGQLYNGGWIQQVLNDEGAAQNGSIDLILCDVTSIGNYDFSSCNKLKSVTLPKVTTIGNNAFEDCTYLQSVNAPSVTNVGSSAFNGCTALTSISLPVATSIGSSAFYGCSALTTVSLPVATSIGSSAFYGCSALTTVSLPKCTKLDAYAFYGCSKLAIVTLPLATQIGSGSFSSCTSLVSISLPEVTKLDAYAFSGCSALKTVTLPKCTQVGDQAFGDCTALTTISLPEATSVGENAFSNCASLATVSLPKCATLGKYAFKDCTTLETITLPEVATLNDWTFQNCSALKAVTLPKCTKLGNSVLYQCYSLESLTFGTPVTYCEKDVFGWATTANVTLTVANGQKLLTRDGSNNPWQTISASLTGGTGAEFCGKTFKEIIISPAT